MSAVESPGPPVVELVIGVQFSPLTKLTSGHFGLFWQHFGNEWGRPADHPLIEDRFESFEPGRWAPTTAFQLRLEPARTPGRFLMYHQDGERLIQFQATRFHLNWRKRGGFYPRYTRLKDEFAEMYQRFVAFVEANQLGPLHLNQWELTYIDAFPEGECWTSHADWPGVLPGLFGPLFGTAELGLRLERRAAEWSYEIEPKRGRLYLSASAGRWGEPERDCLLLNSTARGPLSDSRIESLQVGLDLGHDAAYGAFKRIVADDVRARWEKKS